MRPDFLALFLTYLLMAGGASAGSVDDIAGQWRTVRHGALVEIADCGNGTPCGALAWVDAAISQGNSRDIRNCDPALRDRPLIGVPILWGFEPGGDGWQNGRLYNPDDGKTFTAHLRLLSNTKLRVTGCLGPLCRSQTWTRTD